MIRALFRRFRFFCRAGDKCHCRHDVPHGCPNWTAAHDWFV